MELNYVGQSLKGVHDCYPTLLLTAVYLGHTSEGNRVVALVALRASDQVIRIPINVLFLFDYCMLGVDLFTVLLR